MVSDLQRRVGDFAGARREDVEERLSWAGMQRRWATAWILVAAPRAQIRGGVRWRWSGQEGGPSELRPAPSVLRARSCPHQDGAGVAAWEMEGEARTRSGSIDPGPDLGHWGRVRCAAVSLERV